MTVGALDEATLRRMRRQPLILVVLLDVLAGGATVAVDLRRLQTRTEPNRAASAGIALTRRDSRQSGASATVHLRVSRRPVSSTAELYLQTVGGGSCSTPTSAPSSAAPD